MNRILCSTGAVIGKANGRDFTLLGEIEKQLECDGFEFLMFSILYEKADVIVIKNYIKQLSHCVSSFHVDKYVGEYIAQNSEGDIEKNLECFEINCDMAEAMGAEKLVLHLWNSLVSDSNIDQNIRCYKLLREISDRHGLLLTVENVVCNCADPMTHMRSLLQTYPDISFTFDTKMAAFHGQLDLLYSEENRDIYNAVSHMHINDYGGGPKDWAHLKALHLGNGNIDFDSFFDFILQMDYKGDFTVEASALDKNGNIDFDILNRDFEIIREKIKK